MKKWMDILVDAMFRGVVGLVVLYILRMVCVANDFFVFSGINLLSFLIVSLLGIPGFMLILMVGVIHFL